MYLLLGPILNMRRKSGVCLSNAEKLEQAHILAARIVSVLPIFSSKSSLYYEIGWMPLFSRRKIARLKTMYKVDKNIIPSYIREFSPTNDVLPQVIQQ